MPPGHIRGCQGRKEGGEGAVGDLSELYTFRNSSIYTLYIIHIPALMLLINIVTFLLQSFFYSATYFTNTMMNTWS